VVEEVVVAVVEVVAGLVAGPAAAEVEVAVLEVAGVVIQEVAILNSSMVEVQEVAVIQNNSGVTQGLNSQLEVEGS